MVKLKEFEISVEAKIKSTFFIEAMTEDEAVEKARNMDLMCHTIIEREEPEFEGVEDLE